MEIVTPPWVQETAPRQTCPTVAPRPNYPMAKCPTAKPLPNFQKAKKAPRPNYPMVKLRPKITQIKKTQTKVAKIPALANPTTPVPKNPVASQVKLIALTPAKDPQ